MVRKNYTFANSAESIRRKIETDPSCRQTWESVRSWASKMKNGICDDPKIQSGWLHDFVCPDCVTRLNYEAGDTCTPPGAYLCPHCCKTASGPSLDAAWVTQYRSVLAARVHHLPVGILLGDESASAAMIRYFDYYAAHYAEYEPHGIWVGKGKVLAQSLDEAVWLFGLAQSIYACRDKLPPEKLDGWYRNFFLPAIEFLFPQANRIHNISLWIMCAIGTVAICFDQKEWLSRALDSPFGIREQLRRGFTKDNLWWEGSMHYHYYALQGLTDFLAHYAAVKPDDPIFDLLGRLYAAPLSLSDDGVRFQAINDGWYPIYVRNYLWQMKRAWRFLDEPILENLLISAKDRGETVSLGMLYDYDLPEKAEPLPPKRGVELLPYSLFAVFHSPFYAILKSGVLTDTHMHCDYLSLILPPFSDDIGTPSYGHPMLGSWFHRAPSHNTVTVDGKHPDYLTGFPVMKTRIEESPGGARAVMEKGEWADITRAERTLTEEDGRLADRTVLDSESEHVFDWFFHSVGTADYAGTSVPASLLPEEKEGGRTDKDGKRDANGYEFFENVEKHETDGSFWASFTTQDGKTLVLTVPDTANTEVFTALSPSNPVYEKRNAVILRQRGKNACFTVHFRILS